MTVTNRVKVGLWAVQRAFLDSAETIRGFVGGIGSGKTKAGAYDLIRRALLVPGTYGVGAPSYKVLTRATFATFREWLVTLGLWNPDAFHKSEWSYELPNGSLVYFSTTTNPDYLRGPNLSGFWHDEASYSPDEAHTVILGRLREAGRLGWYSATFTPKGKRNWTYDSFVKNAVGSVELFKARTADNPFNHERFAATMEQQYGASSALAQQELNAEFLDEGAKMFARPWFRCVEALPKDVVKQVRFWDMAATEVGKNKDPDYTVGCLMEQYRDKRHGVADVARARLSPLATKNFLLSTAARDGKGVQILIEQEPGASAKLFIDDMIRALTGYTVKAVPSVNAKAERAGPLAAQAEAGNVLVGPGPWVKDFLDEFETFPGGKHDDQVDAATGAFNCITGTRGPLKDGDIITGGGAAFDGEAR